MHVDERYVIAGGLRTRYFEAGSGPTVILLHGSSLAIDAWSTWHLTIPALAKHYRVLAPDLVGFGLTDVAADGHHVPRLERRHHVAAFMDALGVARCSLVGHSEGGFIAAMLALDYPGRVSNVVVASSGATAPRLGGDLDRAWESAAAQAYDVLGGCETEEAFLRTNAALSLTNPPTFIDIMKENYRLARRRGQLERFKDAALLRGDSDYTRVQEEHLLPFLGEMRARLLLAWSGRDATVPVSRGLKLLERAPQADMHVFADAAHMLMIDRPRAFNAMLAMWLGAAS
ncbi:alpha/beta fold hydrolase [Aquibium oceanicum]|uniref:AB hydrolase-1 domain-containing protein n=1 Tax=Aquibium oceanicum TaxID=1670800 RepID=A0A1L3SQV2_9HYPH|nr:alpha/beta hydrolase [Aquibium oceanicum]APH71672.1 hypothetical protein BSQ44_10055 [Aquibium oceanicum]